MLHNYDSQMPSSCVVSLSVVINFVRFLLSILKASCVVRYSLFKSKRAKKATYNAVYI